MSDFLRNEVVETGEVDEKTKKGESKASQCYYSATGLEQRVAANHQSQCVNQCCVTHSEVETNERGGGKLTAAKAWSKQKRKVNGRNMSTY